MIPGHPELPAEKAAEIKVLAKVDPVPLDLLVRCNLVQQKFTRVGIISIALLNKTVSVAPSVMLKLRNLSDTMKLYDQQFFHENENTNENTKKN